MRKPTEIKGEEILEYLLYKINQEKDNKETGITNIEKTMSTMLSGIRENKMHEIEEILAIR